ncbi:MAG: RNA methyltransferase [Desulfobacterales bacterium]|nr:RNA methyltransferase [Desulfobacterales bacterium]
MALIHSPVQNKNGEVIASAVSNLDLHDISRAAKTYGVQAFYVVTPLEDQRELVREIISHWTEGAGAKYNPDRKDALELIRAVDSVDAAMDEISGNGRSRPATVATDARSHPDNIGYAALSRMLEAERPHLLMFGTAWGLTREFIETADYVLSPIMGPTGYNHLSVRSAAAIILDRLLGNR